MRFLITILLVLGFGCAHVEVREPPYSHCVADKTATNYQLRYCGADYSEEQVGRYLAAFEAEWNRTALVPQNHSKLHTALNQFTIMFQHHLFSNPDGGSPSLLGLTKQTRLIVVYQPQTGCRDLECTALAHELVHLAFGSITGNYQPDHLGGGKEWPREYLGLIARVNSKYQEGKDDH